jgi:hypothetical protein
VKSAGYLQSWAQKKLSTITFQTPKRRAWSREDNILKKRPARQADVYILALHAHMDKSTINPLNLDQWRFYVLSTKILNARTRSQHSITLKTLEKLQGKAYKFDQLAKTVKKLIRNS